MGETTTARFGGRRWPWLVSSSLLLAAGLTADRVDPIGVLGSTPILLTAAAWTVLAIWMPQYRWPGRTPMLALPLALLGQALLIAIAGPVNQELLAMSAVAVDMAAVVAVIGVCLQADGARQTVLGAIAVFGAAWTGMIAHDLSYRYLDQMLAGQWRVAAGAPMLLPVLAALLIATIALWPRANRVEAAIPYGLCNGSGSI